MGHGGIVGGEVHEDRRSGEGVDGRFHQRNPGLHRPRPPRPLQAGGIQPPAPDHPLLPPDQTGQGQVETPLLPEAHLSLGELTPRRASPTRPTPAT